MKRFLVSFSQLAFSLITIATIAYFSFPFWRPYITYSYCDQPITYRIGSIDTRFKLSESEFLQDTQTATAIWNSSYPKSLLKYDPGGKLTISMVYDARQSLNNQLTALEGTVKQGQTSLQSQIDQYNRLAAAFKTHLADFNQRVTTWNNQPSPDYTTYQSLLQEQKDLKTESDSLNATARLLNQSTDLYNTQVNNLNHSVSTYQSALSQKPEEGIYIGSSNRIEIYFNISKNELIHTIAHELGHGIGIEHVNDKNAIMYPYTSDTISLTPGDQQTLASYCQDHTYLENLQIRVASLYQQFQNQFNLK